MENVGFPYLSNLFFNFSLAYLKGFSCNNSNLSTININISKLENLLATNLAKSLSVLTSLIKNLTFHFLQTTLKDIENVFKNLSLFVYYFIRNNSCNNDNSVNHSSELNALRQTALLFRAAIRIEDKMSEMKV